MLEAEGITRVGLTQGQSTRVDLHIHTTASDSRWTPAQVVEGLRKLDIGLFAVADHDSVGAVRTAEALARQAGLAFLRGVEITAAADGHIFHILGYGIDPEDERLLAFLEENHAKLEATDDRVIQNLIALGYEIDVKDYQAYTYARTRGGFKSVNYLIDRGFCVDLKSYFSIRTDIPHVVPDYAPVSDVVSVIRHAGGVPILAHPGVSFHYDGGVTDAGLGHMLDAGIAGVECYSYAHDVATAAFCVDWCMRHDVLITGGSDYHGGFAGRALGDPEIYVADLCLGGLEEKIVTPHGESVL
jgi:hypothetical protein